MNTARQNKVECDPIKPTGRWPVLAALAVVVFFFAGCSLVQIPVSTPKAQVASLQLATNAALIAVPPGVLQVRVMRFADSYVAAVAQAADDFAAQAGTPQTRLAALRWKLSQAEAAYTDATGPSPVVNALDTLVLVTVSRMVMEDYGAETFGEAVRPALEVQRQLENNAWTLAQGMLKPDQQEELKGLIQAWRQSHPNQRYVGAVRFREFATDLNGFSSPSKVAPGSIFSLLYLDPFAGLDPTAAAIEETRRLGERAMYYTQRMPQLLSWQTEVLAYQLATQPESRQILSNANQLATATEVFAQTARQLPQLINDQRQAAIQQLLDGLQSQSAGVRETLDAGADAATAIDGAIQSLDQFVRYVSTPATNAPPATNSPPFNVLDYGAAAGQIGAAARDLNALLTTMNQSTPQLARLGGQATADVNRVVDHAFRKALVLVIVFLAGLALVGRYFWRSPARESKVADQADNRPAGEK